MPVHIHHSADAPQVAANFARFFAEQVAEHEGEYFTVALSGGSTPKRLFELWARDYATAVDWSRVRFFWGDERCVPPEDPDSNFGVTKALFFDHVAVPATNIHRVLGEQEPAQATSAYIATIAGRVRVVDDLPQFDLIILGMGDDGHTASIFPHQMDLLTQQDWCAVATHPTSGQKRVTLTGPVLNHAEQVAFLVTGTNKTEKVAAILGKQSGAEAYPAAHVKPSSSELHWFLDEAAYPLT